MDLQTLKFKVDTSELTQAVAALGNLGSAVTKVNKPVSDNTVATEKATKASKENTTVLQRQQDILKFMTEGYSKGQASVLAYAKASGALKGELSELGDTLTKQRTLMGTDPFDKSIGAMKLLKNEYTVLKEVNRLYNAESNLSVAQMKDLAREKLRLIEAGKIEGKTFSEIRAEIYAVNAAYKEQANLDNTLTGNVKAKQKATSDTAKANAYLEKEINRVNSALREENKELTSGANNALVRFENALKRSGKTASEQVVALENYRKKLAELNKSSGGRQVDYIARALGPQITDIGVGLMTGQNPLTVMLQQGGQLRDQLALAGIAGKDMGKALTDAAKGMVTSIKDVGVAIGSLVVNSLVNVGKAVVSYAIAPFVLMKQVITGAIGPTEALGIAMKGLSSAGILLVVTALATVIVEGYKFLSLQSELSKSIALTGASMGMSTAQAVTLAESMAKAGGSTFAYMGIITEFAKAGAKADETTIKLAKDMDKYLGKAVSQTAQELAKIGDKPLSGLIETAKATGYVSKATLDNVHSLEQQGKTYEAIKAAQDAYILANEKVVAQVKSEMNPAQELWFKIKEGITAAGEAIYNFGTSSLVVEVATTVWETFAVIVSEVWYVLKQTVQTVIDLINVLTAPVGTKLAVFDAAIENAKKAREEHDKSIESILKREAGTKKLTQAEINLRQANADAAKTAEERYKREEEALTLYKSSMANFQNIIAGASTEQKVLNKAQTDYIALLNNPVYKNFSQQMKDNANVEAKLASVMLEMQKGRDYRKAQNLVLEEENANLELQTRLIGATDAARARATGTRKAEIQLIKDLEDIEKYQLDDDAKWKFKADAYQRYSDRVRNTSIEIDNMFKIERMNAYGSAFENVFNGMGDAIVTFVQTGKFNMKSLIDSFIADIIRFEARAQSMAMYRGLGGAGGIMGFFTGDKAKAAAPDNIDVGGGWSPAQAKGGAWSDGMQMFAKGGSFTNSIVDSPTLFKFAKGTGMMGEAGPEAIMPLRRGADGSLGVAATGTGSGSTQINIINNSGVEATTKETIDSRGNRKVDVMIGDVAATEVQRSGSSSQKAMKSTYGIQPNLIRR